MGNRAVITTSKSTDIKNSTDIGIYLHWNGGRDSVQAFLKYCELKVIVRLKKIITAGRDYAKLSETFSAVNSA